MSELHDYDFIAFTLIFASADDVVSAVKWQLSEWWTEVVAEKVDDNLITPFSLKKEHNPKAKKVAIFEIDNGECCLVEANLTDGYDSLGHMVSGILADHMLVKVRSRPVGKGQWPIEELTLKQNKKIIRSVWAGLDNGGWRYGETGSRQSFEEPDNYEKRYKKDRITRELIVSYLKKMGVDLENIAKGNGADLVAFYTVA